MKMSESEYVVIPAYHEAPRVGSVIERAKQYCGNIVVVDDGSSDETSQEAKNKGALVLRHITNLGKGAALKTGCDFAVQNGAEQIIVMDADGQHDPADIPRLFQELKEKDIVFTYRKKSQNMPFVFQFGNWVLNQAVRFSFGIKLQDTQGGFRAMTAEAYKKVRWDSHTYEMESEMIANAGKHGLKYSELPIETVYADKYKGTTMIDGLRIVMKIFWWRMTRWF